MSNYCHLSKSRRAFSLVELLVVLAIIAILAALLFSVFATVRERGRRTTCLSNLKQLGIAFQMYADDSSHYLPPTTAQSAANFTMTWCDLTMPYTKSTQVYICPTDPIQRMGINQRIISYGYNFHVGGVLDPSDKVLSAQARPTSEGQIVKPDRTVLITDSGTTSTAGLPASRWPVKDASAFIIGDAFAHDSTDPSTGFMDAPSARHSGRTNVLWADGHVTTSSIEAFYNAPDHHTPGTSLTGFSPCMHADKGCPD